MTVVLVKIVGDWFEGREVVTALAILMNSWPVGIAIGLWSQGAMAETWGWQTVFLTAGVGSAVGFLLVRAVADEAEILTLGVAPDRRRVGVGGSLLSAATRFLMEQGVRRLFLEVAVDNDAARRLYEARGFATVGRRPAYLPGPAGARDALVMACALDGGPKSGR